MPVAVWLIFITVTHQCNGTSSPDRLEQAQSELLPVVLDQWVAPVDTSTFPQFRAVVPDEFAQANPFGATSGEQSFTRP
jgi:hypothetical protein